MEPDLQQILMEQLRGIHMPAEISWWPPAPGWWILLFLFLAAVVFAIWALIRNRTKNLYRKLAMEELDAALAQWHETGDAAAYVQAANAILKRALATNNPANSLSLSGEPWIGLLNQYSETALTEESAMALSCSGYQPNPKVDVCMLHQELEAWLKNHRSRAIAPVRPIEETAHV